MSEILSQNEIDSLLEALNAGEVDVKEIKEENERKVKKYDFKIPKKLAKDQLRTLQMMYDNFTRLLNTYFSGTLRTYVQMEILSVEELSYYEFCNSISNPAMLAIIDFSPLPGEMILEMSNRLCFTIIDRILGGDGKFDAGSRNFTEIELTILRKIVSQMTKLFIDPWENVIELNPKLNKIETNSQFAQIVSPNETVALITIKVNIGDVEGLINLCMPHLLIEPILPKLSTKLWFTNNTKKITNEQEALLKERLRRAKVEISCHVGEANITVGEFLTLQEGDVIKLASRTSDELTIMVGEKIKYFGKPGSLNKNLAVKITQVIEEGDNEYDE